MGRKLVRHHAVDAYRRAKPRLYEHRRIVEKVVGRYNIETRIREPKPSGDEFTHHPLSRTNEGNTLRVRRNDALLRGKWRVCGDEKSPTMRVRERQVVETLVASRPHEQGEIVDTLAQMHEDVFAVARRNGEPKSWIVAGELRGGACDEAERRCLTCTYRHRPLEFFTSIRLHLRLDALGKIDEIVRAPFQDKSFLGQFDAARPPLE